MSEDLIKLLETLPGAAPFQSRADGLWMDAPRLEITAAARELVKSGARLSTITALLGDGDEIRVIYHYTLGSQAINLCLQTQGSSLESITPITPAANWPEREITDLYAVSFRGHPNPTRLIRPVQLQPGYYREPGGAAGKALRAAKG